MKLIALPAVWLVILALAGCASGVTREGGAEAKATKLPDPKVASIKIYLNDNAQKLHADNVKFNPEALRSTIQRTLEARQLVTAESKQRMEVEITDMRVRSTFASIAFGFMAGADSVKGNVLVFGTDGKPLTKFEVSASYALGGIGGGMDDARMNWLYEEFAKLTINELLGLDPK
jgi:uncharacterized protein DUF4410